MGLYGVSRRVALVLVLLAGVVATTPRAGWAGDEPEGRSDEAYERLIERLEIGMSALKELGRHDVLDLLRRVVDEVRAERAAARERRAAAGKAAPTERRPDAPEPVGDLSSLDRRLEILRFARAAHAEAGREMGARILERAIHVAELERAGASGDEITKATEGLSVDAIVKLLRGASSIYAGRGWEGRAAACKALAEYYAGRDREGPAADRLEDRTFRVEVLRWARAAHAEADRPDRADLLARMVHLGELQLSGASEEALEAASEGLSMEAVVPLLREAAEIYEGFQKLERAKACAALAAFYAKRAEAGESEEEGEEGDEEDSEEEDEGRPSADDARAILEKVAARLAELEKRLQELQAELERRHDRDR